VVGGGEGGFITITSLLLVLLHKEAIGF